MSVSSYSRLAREAASAPTLPELLHTAALAAFGLGFRLWYGTAFVFPLDNDGAFYRGSARWYAGLRSSGPEELVWQRVAEGAHWGELSGMVGSLGLRLSGGAVWGEALMAAIAGALVSGLVYLLARQLEARRSFAVVAALAVTVLDWPAAIAADAEAATFQSALALGACVATARSRPSWALAGALSVLAAAFRAEAWVLVVALGVAGVISGGFRRVLLGATPVLAAWLLVALLAGVGAPWAASSNGLLLASYDDLFDPAPATSFFDEQLGNRLLAGFGVVLLNAVTLVPGVWLVPFALGWARQGRHRIHLAVGLWLVLLLLGYATVASAVASAGALRRGLSVVLPAVAALAAVWGSSYSERAGRAVKLSLLGLLAFPALVTWATLGPVVWVHKRDSAQRAKREHAMLCSALSRATGDASAVDEPVMATRAWTLWYACDRPVEQVITGTCADVEKLLRARHIDLLVVRSSEARSLSPRFECVRQLASSRADPPAGFRVVDTVGGTRVIRYEPARGR